MIGCYPASNCWQNANLIGRTDPSMGSKESTCIGYGGTKFAKQEHFPSGNHPCLHGQKDSRTPGSHGLSPVTNAGELARKSASAALRGLSVLRHYRACFT